jgi:hypothetical protein
MLKIYGIYIGAVLDKVNEAKKSKIAEWVLTGKESSSCELAVLVVMAPEEYKQRAWKWLLGNGFKDTDNLRYIIGYAPRKYQELAAEYVFGTELESWYFCYILVNLDGQWQKRAWEEIQKRKKDDSDYIYLIEFADKYWAKRAWEYLKQGKPTKHKILEALRFATDKDLKNEIADYLFSGDLDFVELELIANYVKDKKRKEKAESLQNAIRKNKAG